MKNIVIIITSLIFALIIGALIFNTIKYKNIANKAVPKTQEKIEVEAYKESMPDILQDDTLMDTEQEKGPASKKKARALPKVESIVNNTGPITKDLDNIHHQLPEAEQQDDSYDGPPVPPGLKTKPLPSFTPITNKTGPAPKESD